MSVLTDINWRQYCREYWSSSGWPMMDFWHNCHYCCRVPGISPCSPCLNRATIYNAPPPRRRHPTLIRRPTPKVSLPTLLYKVKLSYLVSHLYQIFFFFFFWLRTLPCLKMVSPLSDLNLKKTTVQPEEEERPFPYSSLQFCTRFVQVATLPKFPVQLKETVSQNFSFSLPFQNSSLVLMIPPPQLPPFGGINFNK